MNVYICAMVKLPGFDTELSYGLCSSIAWHENPNTMFLFLQMPWNWLDDHSQYWKSCSIPIIS